MNKPEKDTYKYHVKLGSRVVDRGVTYDLDSREGALQKQFPGCRLVQVGRRTTRESALKWERDGAKRAYKKKMKEQKP